MRRFPEDVKQKVVYPLAAAAFLGLVLLLFLSVVRASLFTDVDENKRVWFEVTFLLFTAVLAELLVAHFKQPVVMVLLLVGVLISPSAVSLLWPAILGGVNGLLTALSLPFQLPAATPNLVPLNGVVKIFAQLGSIILLFEIGLHSEVREIFNLKNFVIALLGVILPFAGGFAYASFAGDSFVSSFFLGAALTATSVGVTAAVLKEFRMLERNFAKLILGAAVIDDVLALLVLSLASNFPKTLDVGALSPFLGVLATALIFIVGGIVLGRYVARKYFDSDAGGSALSNRKFLLMLVFVLMYAYVAEFIGLSAIVGAFIAGVTLNYSKIVGKIHEAMFPLEAFFTPIFFISLGMYVDVTVLGALFLPIVVVSAIAIVTKLVGCGLGALWGEASFSEALVVGVGMIPRGEVALIIGLIGLGNGLLSSSEYSLIASMAFVTTLIVPPALQSIMARNERSTTTQ